MPFSVIPELNSPLYQRVGENLNKINLETIGSQVKLTKQNGITHDDVQAELEALHAATGGGDVSGPASAKDGNLAAFDMTTGKLIKDSDIPLSDAADAVAKKHAHDGNPVGDGMRDVVFAENLDTMPADLRDGGLLFVTA